MKSKIANGLLTTFGILLLICSITFTVFAYVGQVPFLPAKNNIVANAQVINGIDYPGVDTSEFNHILHGTFDYSDLSRFYYEITNDDFIAYMQYNSVLFLNIYHEFDAPPLSGYAHAIDNGLISYNNVEQPIVSTFALTSYTGAFDQPSYDAYILYDIGNECYVLNFLDYIGTFGGMQLSFDLYSVPTNNTEITTTESLTDILGNSINFSTSAITTSVKEVFEGLFVNENNTISNYATYVVWFSGIAIALGFFKYILRFILTMGDKK